MEFTQIWIGGRMEINIMIPDTKEDTSYRREFFMTHVDLAKVMTTLVNRSNPSAQAILSAMITYSNYNWEFPLKKGVVKIVNGSIPGNLFPKIPFKFLMIVKGNAKVKGKRNALWTSTFKVYCNLDS